MTDRDIHDAYGRIRPDDAARARMLADLLSAAGDPRRGRRHAHIRRILLVAAVLAAAMLLAAFCWAADLLGLREVNLGPEELTIPELHEDGSLTYDVVTVDSISMQGLAGSPEYQACQEWMDYLGQYDPDGSILAAIGNGPTGLSAEYDAYLCYTREMADELDRLCEKYGLSLLGSSMMDPDVDTLLSHVSAEGLLCTANGVSNEAFWGYRYREGTFFLEGLVTLPSSRPKRVDYQFSRAMKGSLNTATLNIGSAEDYAQWVYTTENGVPLLLATNSASKALVIADLDSSFVVINVLGDWANGSFDLTCEELESFAETFDFTVIP